MVLRSVRNGSDGQIPFVPRISVTTSFVLAMASVIGLVVFLAHLARQIRVETMLRDVHRGATAVVEAVLDPLSEATGRLVLPDVPDRAGVVLAAGSGFVVGLDEGELLAAALDVNAVVVIGAHPGTSLVTGTPMGHAWSPDGTFPPQVWERLQDRTARAARDGSRVSAHGTTAAPARPYPVARPRPGMALGASTLPFIWNVFRSLRYGEITTADDPWGYGNSLEWATSSPPPRHNFTSLPRIRSERPAFELHPPAHAGADAGRGPPGPELESASPAGTERAPQNLT